MHFNRLLITVAIALLEFSGATGEPSEKGSVNPFDRAAMFGYSRGLDAASDVTQYAAFLMPAAFLCAAPKDDYLKIGAMYAGSSVLAFGTRVALKSSVSRDRPYMYFDKRSEKEISKGESDQSFPSGHSIMAFNGAVFTATLFALRYPDSKYRVPVTVAAFTLAGSTAALRVASGEHFMSDVIAGALIGSATGFIVPFAAEKFGWLGDGSGSGVTVTPNCVSYTYRY